MGFLHDGDHLTNPATLGEDRTNDVVLIIIEQGDEVIDLPDAFFLEDARIGGIRLQQPSPSRAWPQVARIARGSRSNRRTEKLRPRRKRQTHSARVVPPLMTTRWRAKDLPTNNWWAESKTSALATRKIASFSSIRVVPSGIRTSRPRLIAAMREPLGSGSSESRLPTDFAPGVARNCCISTWPSAKFSTASAVGFLNAWGDRTGGQILRTDQSIDPQRQSIVHGRLLEVGIVMDSSDGLAGTQPTSQGCCKQIDFVVTGGRKEQIRIRGARLDQYIGMGSAPQKRGDVQPVLYRGQLLGIAIDHGDRMTVSIEDFGSVASDLACAADDDSHGGCSA